MNGPLYREYVQTDTEEPRECRDSLRADRKHSWVFDCDDPYVYCVYCGELRDARTGQVLA